MSIKDELERKYGGGGARRPAVAQAQSKPAAQGRSEKWLYRQLASHGLTSPRQVFLLTVDQLGNTYCVPKEVSK